MMYYQSSGVVIGQLKSSCFLTGFFYWLTPSSHSWLFLHQEKAPESHLECVVVSLYHCVRVCFEDIHTGWKDICGYYVNRLGKNIVL